MNRFDVSRRLVVEAIGTALLLATVIGSGIMGETLSSGNDGIALLGNTIATGAILVVLILIFGPVSGGHFNPAVTLSFLVQRKIPVTLALFYVLAQISGGLLGMIAAHTMFDLPLFQVSINERNGLGQWFSETIATFGLLATIIGCIRFRPEAVAYAVGLYITAGYWFTASTSFANPAVTIARAFTDTFSGINPSNAPVFIVAQLAGAIIATLLFGWLFRSPPHQEEK